MIEILSSLATKAASTVVWEAVKFAWQVRRGRERVIYNGVWTISPADVRGEGGYMYEGDQRIGERGEGNFVVTGGMINLTRTNTAGRYHIFLERVGRKRKKTKFLQPAPDQERRHLIFRFEAKSPRCKHVLRATAHEVEAPKNWIFLGQHKISLEHSDWRSYTLSFAFDATRAAYLRIDDQEVSIAPSSLQIRRLRVTEITD